MSCCQRDIDTDSETEADLAVPIDQQRKDASGRRALMRVLRQVLSLISVAVLLHQQPFMVRPRREKLVPLTLAIGAAVRWAGPIVESSAINVTARSLLTPLEYVSSKPPRRTLSSAYAKTARKFDRLLDTNSTVQQLAGRPSPNLPLIGASLITSGSASAVLLPGAELAVLAGCGCLLFGCPGLAPQPELFAVALLAALGLAALRSSKAADPKPKPRSRRRSKPARPQAPGGDGHGCCH